MDKESATFALFIADVAFISCIVMGPVFLIVGRYLDGIIALVAALLAAIYMIRRGRMRPGQAMLRYWRRYV